MKNKEITELQKTFMLLYFFLLIFVILFYWDSVIVVLILIRYAPISLPIIILLYLIFYYYDDIRDIRTFHLKDFKIRESIKEIGQQIKEILTYLMLVLVGILGLLMCYILITSLIGFHNL